MSGMRRLAQSVFLLLVLSGCDEVAVSGVDEHAAPRLVLQLAASGIDADYRLEGATAEILVPAGSRLAALEVLDAARLLPDVANGRSLESSSLLSSREESVLRIQRARSGHVEEALEHVPGVMEARVLLYEPPQDFPPGARTSSGSAAVLLLVDKERFATESQKIAALVGGATGLTVEKVTVVLNPVEVPRVVNPDRRRADTWSKKSEIYAWAPAVGLGLVLTGLTALLVSGRVRPLRRRGADEVS